MVVNALDFPANLSPIELCQNGGASVRAQLTRERGRSRESTFRAPSLEIVVRNDESVMQMTDAFGPACKRNDGFAGQHVVQAI